MSGPQPWHHGAPPQHGSFASWREVELRAQLDRTEAELADLKATRDVHQIGQDRDRVTARYGALQTECLEVANFLRQYADGWDDEHLEGLAERLERAVQNAPSAHHREKP